ncbi:MAG: LexA family transcriptional regulator [Campylobacteraceae bacterium]|jgi:phage repressor protein C with HTH and peptisase S24 domain|nr:LexA family transcriptional regulator [Campylobacteraceae bacterium]
MSSTIEKIRKIMKDKDIKQKDIICYINESQSAVSKWLSGNEKIRNDLPNTVLLKIAEYLKVSPYYLLDLDEPNFEIAKQDTQQQTQYDITLISQKASAGEGVEITDIEVFDTKQKISIDKVLFKTPQNGEDLRITQIDGHSMLPMLYPDNYVIFDITKNNYSGDGLYVILWRNVIMVKLLQISDVGNLEIISVNKDYKSYTINPDDQTVFRIAGKVVRVVM